MIRAILLCVACGLASLAVAQQQPIRLATTEQIPPVFTPNLGQWPGAFSLKTSLPGVGATAFFGGGTWTFLQRRPHQHAHTYTATQKAEEDKLPLAHAWRMQFVGASPAAKADTIGPVGYVATYISKNRTTSTQPTSQGKVRNLYPGIDARLLFHNNALRFDIEVSPHRSLSQIKIKYEGITYRLLKGLLVLENSFGSVFQTVPKAYQLNGADTTWVPAEYTLAKGEVGFSVGKYHTNKPLYIDPTLIFSTYSTSISDNWGSTATYGLDGSMYSGGTVFGDGFPVTLGALDTNYRGVVDAGILKYSADGHRLLWATYLGGSSADDPVSLYANADGELYILSITGSANFPVTKNGADTSFGGGPLQDPLNDGPNAIYYRFGSDLAVSKLSTNGGRLIGSTFLGGSGTDGLLRRPDSSALHKNYGDCFRGEIILDATGHPCVATHSLSPDFTPAISTIGRLGRDGQGIVLRLSKDLDSVYSRIAFGGSGLEAAYGLAQDSLGRTFVCGGTVSSDFPATTGSYQRRLAGAQDGFLVRIAADWSGIDAATYIGTPAYDQAYLVQIDNQGEPVVVGQTAGTYPRSRDVWTQGNAGGQFIHGFNANLTQTAFSTAYGGPSPNVVITAFLIDVCNQIYVAGWGGNVNTLDPNLVGGSTFGLPTTPDALQANTDGSDFHVLVLNPRASSLSYGTFFGANFSFPGEHVDGGTSRFDRRSIVYEAVCACGGTRSPFPVTPGVFGPRLGSNNCNNAAFKFDFSPLRAAFQAKQLAGCAPFTLEAKNLSLFATSYSWVFDTLGTSRSADSVVNFTFTKPGRYKVKLRAYNDVNCFRKDSTEITLTVNGFDPQASVLDTTLSLCALGVPVPLPFAPPPRTQTVRWQPGIYLSDSMVATPSATLQGSQKYQVTYSDPTGCSVTGRVRLIDRRLIAQTNLRDTASCGEIMLNLKANVAPGGSYAWYQNGNKQDTTLADTLRFTQPGRYVVRFVARNDTTCARVYEDSAIVKINLFANGAIPLDTTYSLCSITTPLQLNTPLPPGRYNIRWLPGTGLSDSTIANPRATVQGNSKYLVTLRDSNNCPAAREVRIIDRRLIVSSNLSDSAVCQFYSKLARTSISPGGRVQWFIDGNRAGNLSLQVLQLSQAGKHTIRLLIENDTACVRSYEDSAIVSIYEPRPAALYTDTTVHLCPGDPLQLIAPEYAQGYRYAWTTSGSSTLLYIDTLPALEATGAAPGQTLQFTLSQNGCQNQRQYKLVADTLTPTYVQAIAYDSCLNKYANTIVGTNRTAQVYTYFENASPIPLLPTNPYTRLYEGNSQTVRIQIQARRRGCKADTAFSFVAKDAGLYPKARFFVVSQYPDCNGPALISLVSGAGQLGTARYKLDNTSLPELNFRLADSLPHTVMQISRLGPCADSSSVIVQRPLLQVGNVVTPNLDGRNDALQLPTTSTPWSLDVYNRWGKPVAHLNPYPEAGFPGQLPAGVYFYRLQGGGLASACSGWIEVVRP